MLFSGAGFCVVFQKVGSVGSSSGFGDGPLLQAQKVHRKLGSQNLHHRPSARLCQYELLEFSFLKLSSFCCSFYIYLYHKDTAETLLKNESDLSSASSRSQNLKEGQ